MDKLTRREVEVLLLIAEGYLAREVAGMLFISKRTVDFHMANIYLKLEVSNKIQAINKARKRGLL